MLYIQGIDNEIVQEEKRKMSRRTKSSNLGAGGAGLGNSMFDDASFEQARMQSIAAPL